MSAFSRGLGLALNQRIFSSVPTTTIPANSPILQAARNLHASARLCKPKPPKVKPPQAKPPKAKPKAAKSKYAIPSAYIKPTERPSLPSPFRTTWNAGASLAAAARLAKSGQPTLLYESPSHFWFHFFSLLTATFCLTYAGMHYYWHIWNKPEGCHWLLPVGWAFICLAIAATGAYFVFGTRHIVRRITAVPKELLPKEYRSIGAPNQSPRVAHTAALLKDSPVAIEVTLSQLFSRASAKKIIAAPSEVWLAIRMQDLARKQDIAKTAERAVIRPPNPTRDTILDKASDTINNIWTGAKRSFVKGGFIPIKVSGDRYRLDVDKGAKVLDGGKTVDVLLPCYPGRFEDGLWQKFLGT